MRNLVAVAPYCSRNASRSILRWPELQMRQTEALHHHGWKLPFSRNSGVPKESQRGSECVGEWL